MPVDKESYWNPGEDFEGLLEVRSQRCGRGRRRGGARESEFDAFSLPPLTPTHRQQNQACFPTPERSEPPSLRPHTTYSNGRRVGRSDPRQTRTADSLLLPADMEVDTDVKPVTGAPSTEAPKRFEVKKVRRHRRSCLPRVPWLTRAQFAVERGGSLGLG